MREAVFSEIGNRQGFNFMVRTGDYKWFLTNGTEFLFHLSRDPYEQHNLAEEAGTSDLRLDMRERLLQFLMSDQENHAAGYLPLFQRMGLQVSGQEGRLRLSSQPVQPDSWPGTLTRPVSPATTEPP